MTFYEVYVEFAHLVTPRIKKCSWTIQAIFPVVSNLHVKQERQRYLQHNVFLDLYNEKLFCLDICWEKST